MDSIERIREHAQRSEPFILVTTCLAKNYHNRNRLGRLFKTERSMTRSHWSLLHLTVWIQIEVKDAPIMVIFYHDLCNSFHKMKLSTIKTRCYVVLVGPTKKMGPHSLLLSKREDLTFCIVNFVSF